MWRLLLIMLSCWSCWGATKEAEKKPEPYLLPVWMHLDVVDRKYPGPVYCEFDALSYRPLWSTPTHTEYDFLGRTAKDMSTGSADTLADAINKSCDVCTDRLKIRRKEIGHIYGLNYKQFNERCSFEKCYTVNGRKLSLSARVLKLALDRNKSTWAPACVSRSEKLIQPNPEYEYFFKVFSRPNDDSFQNEAGEEGNGEPYEVAIMYGALVLHKDPKKKEIALRFDWKAEVTTGRQVEAGKFICMHQLESNVPGEKPKTVIGEEDQERHEDLKITYPKGVTEDSWFEDKPGSVLSASLPLGKVWDGTYSGKLVVRGTRPGRGRPAMDGLEAIPPSKSKLGGIIKKIDWSLTLKDGKVVDKKVEIVRAHNDPPLRLVDSNFVTIDHSLAEHKHYYQQERRQICKSETVGDGDLPTAESKADELTRKAGELVKAAGCLECHGEGAADDKFRFCDSGISIRPREDAMKLNSMVEHGVPKNKAGREPYPDEMVEAVAKLKKLDEEKKILAKWAKFHSAPQDANKSAAK